MTLQPEFRENLQKYLHDRAEKLIEIQAMPPKEAYEKWNLSSLGDYQFGRFMGIRVYFSLASVNSTL